MIRTLCVLAVACSAPAATPRPAEVKPPIAVKRPHAVVSPHGTRSDPYFWLRDDARKDPAVLAYLEAENAYGKAVLASIRSLEDELYNESRARVDEDEVTVPVRQDGFDYYARYERGKQHAIYARRKAGGGREEILFDANDLSRGHAFYGIGDYEVSRDGRLLAWTEDTVGKSAFTLRVKDLSTGKLLADTLTNLASSVVWANDNKTVFVVGRDPATLREDRVIRHAIGGRTEIVYREQDTAFYVDVGITKSRELVTIELDATTTSEILLVDANRPASAPRVYLPRKVDRVYDVDHLDGRFVMRTNEDAENFRIVVDGKDVVPHRADVLVEDFAVYPGMIAVGIRENGLARIRVIPDRGKPFDVEPKDPTYVMDLDDTPEGARVRYSYESLTTPTSTYEVDARGTRTLLKQESVPTYDPSKYASEYLRATARDGAHIPISVAYRKGVRRPAPLLVLGYGAYGVSFEPRFDRERASLLDRGWIVAIAHVRGGQELGDAWYEAGRGLAKKNSFTDFIAATEHLVTAGYAARDRIFAEGGSAGGLLVGAVANMRPDLYRGIIAWVPFVDVVTTMLDESIPLVTNEYEEWGNPKDKEAYDYMLSYSPYDNVRAQRYPALYVRTGLHDSLVPYWEPAKWVAKLRATAPDTFLVFETDMHAGHAGSSGRYAAIREECRAYAFLLTR